jgi:hypothetical protein
VPENVIPEGKALYLAIKWPGLAPAIVSNTLSGPGELVADVDPPESVRSSGRCAHAEGNLLAYFADANALPNPEGDELVAASQRPEDLFLAHGGYEQRIVWNDCNANDQRMKPLLLQRDARLALALCEEPVTNGMLCGQPILDRTRISGAQLTAHATGAQFFPRFAAIPTGASVVIEVNGSKTDAPNGQLVTQAGRCSVNPWRAGSNSVRITVGDAPAWEARVVLPKPQRAHLRDAGLRKNASFTVDWNRAPWADAARVGLWPVNLPFRRTMYPQFDGTGPSLIGTFAGFNAPGGGVEWDTHVHINHQLSRTQVVGVTGTGAGNTYALSYAESFIVPVLP